MSLLFITTICLLYSQYRTENVGDTTQRQHMAARERNYTLRMQWVEEMDSEGNAINMDIFFDRVVMVGLETSKTTPPTIVSTGVMINSDHVLTSYNAHRETVRKKKTNDFVVAILTGRMKTGRGYSHRVIYYSIACHSQVPQVIEQTLRNNQWHGDFRTQSPVHDLFVLRLALNKGETVTLLKPTALNGFDYVSSSDYTDAGPLKTELARNRDWLGWAVKFASLGYMDEEDILAHNKLSSMEFDEGVNPIADCDEWFLRNWGWFICVKNEDQYKGIGSGAVLIYKNSLFGIGSFTLTKGNLSVFVFTDVRPYRLAIFQACVDQIPPWSDYDEAFTTPKSYDILGNVR